MEEVSKMNCWHCKTELIWGGDHDVEDSEDYDIVSNLSCPKCNAYVDVYHCGKEMKIRFYKNRWLALDWLYSCNDWYVYSSSANVETQWMGWSLGLNVVVFGYTLAGKMVIIRAFMELCIIVQHRAVYNWLYG